MVSDGSSQWAKYFTWYQSDGLRRRRNLFLHVPTAPSIPSRAPFRRLTPSAAVSMTTRTRCSVAERRGGDDRATAAAVRWSSPCGRRCVRMATVAQLSPRLTTQPTTTRISIQGKPWDHHWTDQGPPERLSVSIRARLSAVKASRCQGRSTLLPAPQSDLDFIDLAWNVHSSPSPSNQPASQPSKSESGS